MAESEALFSCGLGLEQSDISPGDGSAVGFSYILAEITDIEGPNISITAIDVTHLRSDDCAREFIQGLEDGGEVTFSANWTSAAYTQQLADRRGRYWWRLRFPDDTGVTWKGFYTEPATPSGQEDTEIGMSATIKVSGQATYGLIV